MNLTKSKIFLFCCFTFMAGIALASFSPAKWIEADLWWFGAMVGFLVITILFWKNYYFRILGLIGLFLFLGIWRYSVGLPEKTPDKIWHYNGQAVTAIGLVTDEPDIRQNNQKLKIKTEKIILAPKDSAFLSVEGNVLATVNLYPGYNYGDKLKIICDFKQPEKFDDFSYDRYLSRYNIYSVCYYPEVEILGSGGGGWFYKKSFQFKNKLRGIINYGLSEPEGSLVKAIILGDKRGIPGDLRENFSQVGISHIVAISGMHISILAALVMSFLLAAGFPRKRAFYLAVLFLLFYIALIGMPASAMRAGLMGFLVLLALNLGRLNKITNSLVLAAGVLLFINPKLLRDDIGFQLSFLAVLGIVYCYPILEGWFDKIKIPKLKGVRDIFNITIAAQVFTLPLVAYNFSTASLIAPLANLLVLWTLPVLMIAVLAALVLSFVLPSFSFLFFLPANFLAKYIILVASWLAEIPYAYLEINYLWWGWVVAYYILVVWGVAKLKNRNKENPIRQK